MNGRPAGKEGRCGGAFVGLLHTYLQNRPLSLEGIKPLMGEVRELGQVLIRMLDPRKVRACMRYISQSIRYTYASSLPHMDFERSVVAHPLSILIAYWGRDIKCQKEAGRLKNGQAGRPCPYLAFSGAANCRISVLELQRRGGGRRSLENQIMRRGANERASERAS